MKRTASFNRLQLLSTIGVCLLSPIAFVLSGCGGGGGGASNTPPPPISVGVSTANASIDQGQSTTITATVANDSSNKGVTWSVTCGASPCGTVSPQSTASGTATTYTAPAGAVKATITATAVADSSKAASSSVTVNATPVITPPANNALPAATVGAAYSFDLNTLLTGGTAPFTWSLTSGTLPAGLTLSSSGTITGTPTQTAAAFQPAALRAMAQSSAVSVTLNFSAKDSGNPPVVGNIQLTLTIIPPPLAITTTSLPGGAAGAAYGPSGAGAPVTATGGITPYIWTISGMPAGLTFASGTPTATISGTTCQVGTFPVKATVTDAESPVASVSANYSLAIAPGSLSITTTSPLANATLNSAYSTTISATGGCAPYTWSLASGSVLPAGLSLTSGSSGATISGTPTVTGTYKFTVQVADSESPALTASATFLLTSTESPAVTCPVTVNLTLCGTYNFGLRGFNISGGPKALAGVFVADNAGHIATSGAEDINTSTSSTGGQNFTVTGGSYAMDSSGDGRGMVTLIYSDASSTSYRFALVSTNSATPGTDYITSPIEEFDASGAPASGVIVGPAQLPLVPPSPGRLALALEGANGSGQRVGLLGEIHLAGQVSIGCDGTSGTFVSVSGENVFVNTKGAISNVAFAGTCASDSDYGSTGRNTATVTVSGGTPFANSTLHFVFYQLNFKTYFFLETDPIGPNQPILSGVANAVTPVTSGITGSFVDCSCIFAEHGTTDGTITSGKSIETVISFGTTASGDSGTLTGIEDRNAGGSLTLDAAVSGTYTVDDNSVGTMTLTTPSGTRTIHFIIDGNAGTSGSASDNLDTLDESTSVQMGSSHQQLNTIITTPGAPFVLGLGFFDLPYGLGYGLGNSAATPSNALAVGVVTPAGTTTSGTLSGISDVMPGLYAGTVASGDYSIDSTTGRGTGTISLTNGSTINAVFWVLDGGKVIALDVQTTNPELIGLRQQ